jgi:hypothetical protein
MATGQNVNLYHLERAAGKRASVVDRHESRFGAVAVLAFYLLIALIARWDWAIRSRDRGLAGFGWWRAGAWA